MDINTIKNEYLLKTEDLFVANKKIWFADFTDTFQSICAKIAKLQNESFIPSISYLEYIMPHANFINRRYAAEVWVYGDEWYLDKNQCLVGEYDLSFLFIYFNELWDRLISARRRYIGKLTVQEINSYMMQALPDFYSYLISIARFAIKDLIDKKPYTTIAKNELFRVNIGDYMGRTEPVFTEMKNKNADKLMQWFSEQLEDKYFFGDYSGLDFSEKSFPKTDFRYAQFQDSVFYETSFIGSSLIGANFRNANMEKCRLDNCLIYEADFSYAILKNASFANTYAKAGLSDEKIWQSVGLLPVMFHNADLTNVDFTGADLTGADFTDAILEGTNFTGAVLDGAIFSDNADV